MNVEDKVIAIIKEQLGLPKGEVLLTSTKESLGMDSLDKIETLMALEEEFDIEINDHQAEKFNTVQDVVDFIKVNQVYNQMSKESYNAAKEVFREEYNGKTIHDVVDKNKYPLSYTYEQLQGKDLVAHKDGYMEGENVQFCKKGNTYKIDSLFRSGVLSFIDEEGDPHDWDFYDVGEYFYPVDKVKDTLYNPVKNISREKYHRCNYTSSKLFRSNRNGSCLWMYLSNCSKYYYWSEYNSKNNVIYFRGEVDWVESNYDDYEKASKGVIVSFDSNGVVGDCKLDTRELGCEEEYVSVVEIPEADEYTGSSVSYYKLKVDNPTTIKYPYEVECNDIIETLDMNYAEGNAFKALWRRCAAKKFGLKKKGYDNGLYDAEKVVFFGERLVEQSKNSV